MIGPWLRTGAPRPSWTVDIEPAYGLVGRGQGAHDIREPALQRLEGVLKAIDAGEGIGRGGVEPEDPPQRSGAAAGGDRLIHPLGHIGDELPPSLVALGPASIGDPPVPVGRGLGYKARGPLAAIARPATAAAN